MKLDAVWCDPSLSVNGVEEADAVDGRRAVKGAERARRRTAGALERSPRRPHLARGGWRRPRDAVGGRHLDNHRPVPIGARRDHEVYVAIVFAEHADEPSSDAVHRCLHRRLAKAVWVAPHGLAPQDVDAGRLRREVDERGAAVLQSLLRPALYATGDG